MIVYYIIPYFNFRWLNKNKRQILSMGLIKTEGSDLVFENPQQIDSGNYTFIVNNTAGERRQNVWIIVSGKRIMEFDTQTHVKCHWRENELQDFAKHPVYFSCNIV